MTGMTIQIGTDGVPYLWDFLPLIYQMRRIPGQSPADIREHIVAVRQRTSVFRDFDLTLRMVLRGPCLPAPLRTLHAHGSEHAKLPLQHIVDNPGSVTIGGEWHDM